MDGRADEDDGCAGAGGGRIADGRTRTVARSVPGIAFDFISTWTSDSELFNGLRGGIGSTTMK